MKQKRILLIGDPHLLEKFISLLKKNGIAVTQAPTPKQVMELILIEEIEPDAIAFILPRYWYDITLFVDDLRKKSQFAETPILYVGSLIEGEDQRILQQKGVKTLTLGPLPPEEIVRYITNTLV